MTKNIVFIIDTRTPFDAREEKIKGLGGVETTTIQLTRELAKLGHKIIVLTRFEEAYELHGVKWQNLRELPNLKADVFISCNDAKWFDKINKENKNPHLITWLHNPLRLEKAIRKKQFLPILKYRPDVVCVGKNLLKSINPLLLFENKYVIGHGISDEFLNTEIAQLKDRKNYAVWVSQPQRGLKETILAWEKYILPKVKDAQLYIFGIVPSDINIKEEKAKSLNLIFMPRAKKQEIADFYNKSKLLLCPGAEDETFCLAAAEAQCMGVPVVTKGIGSLWERVKNNYNGIIGKSPKAFAEGAINLFTDNNIWNRLSKGAKEQRKSLNWPVIADEWHKLIIDK